MDNVDKRLISMLMDDGRMSLSKIGKSLGMSHVAISKRLDKLTERHGTKDEEALLKLTAGVNAEELDMKLLFMALETESMDVTERLVKKYQNCPRILMLAPVTGRYNLFTVMAAEDTWSLESIIGTCSMRTESGVRRSETWFGNAPPLPKYLSLKLAPGKSKSEKTPCSRTCLGCKRYKDEKCVGCPTSESYKGLLWESPLTKRRRRKSKS